MTCVCGSRPPYTRATQAGKALFHPHFVVQRFWYVGVRRAYGRARRTHSGRSPTEKHCEKDEGEQKQH